MGLGVNHSNSHNSEFQSVTKIWGQLFEVHTRERPATTGTRHCLLRADMTPPTPTTENLKHDHRTIQSCTRSTSNELKDQQALSVWSVHTMTIPRCVHHMHAFSRHLLCSTRFHHYSTSEGLRSEAFRVEDRRSVNVLLLAFRFSKDFDPPSILSH